MPPSVPFTAPTSKKLTTTNQHYVEIYSYAKFHLDQPRNTRNTGRIKLRPLCEVRRIFNKLETPRSDKLLRRWHQVTDIRNKGRGLQIRRPSYVVKKAYKRIPRANIKNWRLQLTRTYLIVNHIGTNNTVRVTSSIFRPPGSQAHQRRDGRYFLLYQPTRSWR